MSPYIYLCDNTYCGTVINPGIGWGAQSDSLGRWFCSTICMETKGNEFVEEMIAVLKDRNYLKEEE